MSLSAPPPDENVNRGEGRLSSLPIPYRGLALRSDVTGKNFTEEGRAKAKQAFIEAYATSGTIRAGCRAAGINRATYYSWLEADPEFVDSLQLAKEDHEDAVREEIQRRAVEGTLKEHRAYFRGEIVDIWHEREYSDTLLGQMAKAKLPEYKKDEAEEDKKIPLAALQGILDTLNGTGRPGGTIQKEGAGADPHARPHGTRSRAREDIIDVDEYQFKDTR